MPELNILESVKLALRSASDNKYDTTLLSKVTDARLSCAIAILNLNEKNLSEILQGSLGDAIKLLIKNGVTYVEPSAAEITIFNEIKSSLNLFNSLLNNKKLLVSAMLYIGPHSLANRPNIQTIKDGAQEIYRLYLLTPPTIFLKIGEADQYASFFIDFIREIHESIISNNNSHYWNSLALDFVNTSSMIPLYFSNSALKNVMSLRAKIIEHIISNQDNSVSLNFNFPPNFKKRIRVGILAAHYRPQTETYATLPVYSHLDRDNFEIILISQIPFGNHPLEKHCLSFSDQSVSLSGVLTSDVIAIRNLNLDALWIGTNLTAVMNYMVQLSVHRLARIQLTGGCSPTTTGFSNIDFFVSGTATEPENGADDYTERLHLVEGPAHCFDMATSLCTTSDTSVSLTRDQLGISKNTILFISGANFFKIIPELIQNWINILSQTNETKIILFPFNPNWTSNYPVANFIVEITRHANAAGINANRFIIVPPLPDRMSILELIRMSDIYLDSFPYSGMTSLLDPLEACLPIVAVEGSYQRQRMSSSALHSLNLHDWLVSGSEAYVERAVHLSKNSDLLLKMKSDLEKAMKKIPPFLNPSQFSKSIGVFLINQFTSNESVSNMHPNFENFLIELSNSNFNEAYKLISNEFTNDVDNKIANALKGICTSHFIRQRATKLNALSNIKKAGFEPKLVIDVGAQVGTPELYTVYPDAHHIFIEPVEECISTLKEIASQLRSADVMHCAISNINAKTTLSITDSKQYSSIETKIGEEVREIDAKTIDSIFEQIHITGSVLLKIDVDGPELKVLQGSKNLLRNHDCVVVIESCLACEPARFSSITEYMSSFGYEVFDIIDSLYRPSDWNLWQVDLILVKSNSFLRENSTYTL